MIKLTIMSEGVIMFNVDNSPVEAVFLSDFKQVSFFYNKEKLETISTEEMKVSEFFKKLLSFNK